VLRERETDFTARGFGRALEALGYINRTEENKDEAREFIAEYVNHQKPPVQLSAIRALGILGDPRAIPVVETFAGEEPADRIQRVAREALERLQKSTEIPVELYDLRKEVIELQKANKKLEEEMDTIKRRIELKPEKKPERKKILGIF
jgi:aminopeptidase N